MLTHTLYLYIQIQSGDELVILALALHAVLHLSEYLSRTGEGGGGGAGEGVGGGSHLQSRSSWIFLSNAN